MDDLDKIKRQVRALAFKQKILRVEAIIGVIAMILGAWISILVWDEGYFLGAFMLVMTGALNLFLSVKELKNPTDNILHWQSLMFLILRRTTFILNVVLSALVIGTMTHLIE